MKQLHQISGLKLEYYHNLINKKMKKLLTILIILLSFEGFTQTLPPKWYKVAVDQDGYATDTLALLEIKNAATSGLAGIMFISDTDTSYLYFDGTQMIIPDYAGGGGGGGYWTQSGTDLYYNIGNVGVNVTDPDYPLEVDGSLFADSVYSDRIYLSGAGSQKPLIIGIDDLGLAALTITGQTSSNLPAELTLPASITLVSRTSDGDELDYRPLFAILNDTAKKFFIDANGDVGIGFNNYQQALYKLHVNGTAAADQVNANIGEIDTIKSTLITNNSNFSETMLYIGEENKYIDINSNRFRIYNGNDNDMIINSLKGTDINATTSIDLDASDVTISTSDDLLIDVDDYFEILTPQFYLEGSGTIGLWTDGGDLSLTSTNNDIILDAYDLELDAQRNMNMDIAATFDLDANHALLTTDSVKMQFTNDYMKFYELNDTLRIESSTYPIKIDTFATIILNVIDSLHFGANGAKEIVSYGDTLATNEWVRTYLWTESGDTIDSNSHHVRIDSNLYVTDSLILTDPSIYDATNRIFNFDSKYNLLLGSFAGEDITTSTYNTALGMSSLRKLTEGNYNTSVGFAAGYNVTTGEYNVFLGQQSGRDISTTSNNTMLGYRSGYSSTGANNVFLGYQSGYSETGSNKLYIENSDSSDPLIYGEFDNDFLKFNTDSVKMQFDGDYIKYYEDGDTVRINTGTKPVKFNNLLIPSSTSTSGVWEVNGDKIYYNDGNVGINTSNPMYRLDIEGTASMDTLNLEDSVITVGNNATFLKVDYKNTMYIGLNSGLTNTGGNNVFLGVNTGLVNTSGANNVFLGTNAGYSNTSSNGNLFMGYKAGYDNSIGGQNVFLGSNAGENNTTASSNLFMGAQTGYTNKTGAQNVYVGKESGYLSTGSGNIFFGYQSGYNETGSNKLYIENSNSATPLIGGDFTADTVRINGSLSIKDSLHFNGNGAKAIATYGDTLATNEWVRNIAGSSVSFGTSGQIPYVNATTDDFLYSGKISNSNTFLGLNGAGNFTGANNAVFGYNSGYTATSVDQSVFLGSESGYSTTTGDYNNFIGYKAGYTNTTGANNVFIGKETGLNNETGTSNVFIGNETGKMNTASSNTYVGHSAGANKTTGSSNSIYGYLAGSQNSSGAYNTILGALAGYNSSGSSNVSIGFSAGYHETGNNKLIIDNEPFTSEANARDSSLIYGEFDNDIVRINGGLQLKNNGITTYTIKKTIIADSVLVSYTRPQELIPAPGDSKIINIISIGFFFDYNSVAYATNTSVLLKFGSSTVYEGFSIAATSDQLQSANSSLTDSGWYLNENFNFTIDAGDPTDGNSPITFYITYQIIEL